MLNMVSLFSGIGAFEKALDKLGIKYNLLGYCEIDKNASRAYSLIHKVSEDKNYHDVTKIDDLDFFDETIDLITYGFPCQDISLAGNMKGFIDQDGNTTRSGLFFEALRIIEEYKPKYAIAENVKNLTSKKFSKEFTIVLDSLEKAGYVNYWKVLNAKDYGVPQRRERVFIISIRKDLNQTFVFPEPVPLEKRLKDLLEDKVDPKYYLSQIAINGYMKHKERQMTNGNGFQFAPVDRERAEIAKTITTRSRSRPTDNFIEEDVMNIETIGQVDCPGTMTGGDYLAIKENTLKGYKEAYEGDSVNLERPNSTTRRGRVGNQVAQTLTTACNQGVVTHKRSIRKFTPTECFRLMGFDDEDCKVLEDNGISNAQLYKMAGNSIVVDVLMAIFTNLLGGAENQ